MDDNKTLIITRAVLNNTGEYSCHATNNLSYTNKSLILDFKGKYLGKVTSVLCLSENSTIDDRFKLKT